MKWGTICECLPWEDREQEESLRKYLHTLVSTLIPFLCDLKILNNFAH